MKNHQMKKKSSRGRRPGESPAQEETSEIIDLRRNVGDHTQQLSDLLIEHTRILIPLSSAFSSLQPIS
jgi:hypothetical protein